jgi:hypothetical protein
VINWDTVVDLCEIHCTGQEIASIIGVDRDTLNAACKREQGVGFSAYFMQKSAGGKCSLRRRQFKLAVGEEAVIAEDGTVLKPEVPPNVTMLIFLGKAWLGQSDKLAVDQRSSDGSMSPNSDAVRANGDAVIDLLKAEAALKKAQLRDHEAGKGIRLVHDADAAVGEDGS